LPVWAKELTYDRPTNQVTGLPLGQTRKTWDVARMPILDSFLAASYLMSHDGLNVTLSITATQETVASTEV